MSRETEIKLKIDNPKSLLRSLSKLGAKPSVARTHELNVIFDTPEGGLAKHGQLLRIRSETLADAKKKSAQRTLLTFKSPPGPLASGAPASPADRHHKVREEIEVVLTDAPALQKIFEGLGLRGWFRYEKFRTTYKLPARQSWAKHLLIELDETPVGTFVELEGPGDAIDRAARELGYSVKDYILKNYLVVYLDNCRHRGVPPGDMLFPQLKKK
jgi:adenylate cyclase class 2